MIQYLKLKNKDTIVYPPEIATDKKSAEELFGKGNFVKHKIEKSDDPATFADKLIDGKVVFDDNRLVEAKKFNDEIKSKKRADAKIFRRTQAIQKAKEKISTTNFDINKLSAFELKVMFNIDGGPTDNELGIV